MEEIRAAGFQVIAVTQDEPDPIAETKKKHGLQFLMLSDTSMEAARKMGIAFKVDEKTVKLYRGYGVDLIKLYGRTKPLLAVPAVFIAQKDRKIRFEYVNPDHRIRLDPHLLMAALKVYAEQ